MHRLVVVVVVVGGSGGRDGPMGTIPNIGHIERKFTRNREILSSLQFNTHVCVG